MVSEPECMIPIATFDSVKQVLVLGDIQQVPYNIRSPVARSQGLTTSLLDRYRNQAVRLQTQYRMVSLYRNQAMRLQTRYRMVSLYRNQAVSLQTQYHMVILYRNQAMRL